MSSCPRQAINQLIHESLRCVLGQGGALQRAPGNRQFWRRCAVFCDLLDGGKRGQIASGSPGCAVEGKSLETRFGDGPVPAILELLQSLVAFRGRVEATRPKTQLVTRLLQENSTERTNVFLSPHVLFLFPVLCRNQIMIIPVLSRSARAPHSRASWDSLPEAPFLCAPLSQETPVSWFFVPLCAVLDSPGSGAFIRNSDF